MAGRISRSKTAWAVDGHRVETWIRRYCSAKNFSLSGEQADAVKAIVGETFSVLTGGPGCGKTTTTLILVRLLEAMGRKKSCWPRPPAGPPSA